MAAKATFALTTWLWFRHGRLPRSGRFPEPPLLPHGPFSHHPAMAILIHDPTPLRQMFVPRQVQLTPGGRATSDLNELRATHPISRRRTATAASWISAAFM
jgi:hypothetical protein